MKSLMKSISKFSKSLRESGVAMTLFKILHRVRILSAVHPLDFFVYDLRGEASKNPVEVLGARLTLRELRAEELDTVQFAACFPSRDWILTQYGRGSRLFIALDGNRVVSMNWFNPRYANLDYIRHPLVKLPDKVAYIHSSLTAPDFRNQGIGSWIRSRILGVMKQEGFDCVIVAMFIENKRAAHWNLKSGFQSWGRITYLIFLGRPFWHKSLKIKDKKLSAIFDHVVSFAAQDVGRFCVQTQKEATCQVSQAS